MSSAPSTIDRIAHIGIPFERYRFGEDPQAYVDRIEAQVEALKRTGATHLLVNEAPCALPRILDPRNMYMQFFEYAYCLDQFVTTDHNRGIYYEKVKDLNRELLLAHADLARRHGFRCYVMCLEPTFMQEAMFERFPHWRGPRVDNPDCSHKPIFAPCVHLKEVQDYYREMMGQLVSLVPEIDEIHIPTNDTGGGYCYSEGLYAGPNGPRHCRDVPAGVHAQEFARALLEGGQQVNPDFRVVLTSGLSPREKAQALADAPEGVCSSVYGALAWQGGMEAYWGTMAVGPGIFQDAKLREETRTWVDDDMAARFRPARQNNAHMYAAYSPLYYRYDDPRPFETYRIICRLLELGARNLIGGAPDGGYSINGAVMRRAFAHGPEACDEVIREIASVWLGADGPVDDLLAIWRLTNEASCEQPMLAHSGHCIWHQNWFAHMPLVPDDCKIAQEDLTYFSGIVEQDGRTTVASKGGVWRCFNYGQEDMDAYIAQYDAATLPLYEQALEKLDRLMQATGLSSDAHACLQAQKDAISTALNGHQHIYLWLQAARHKLTHLAVPADAPSFQAVVDQMLALPPLRRPAGLVPADAPPLPREEQDRSRKRLMRMHREDALVEIDLTDIAVHRHPGLKGYLSAHA